MHDAYGALPVLERLPLGIECIACYGQADDTADPDLNYNSSEKSQTRVNELTLLVGTRPGHLLIYKVIRHFRSNNATVEAHLEKTIRTFSKRPIQQLFVSSELKILISLCDGLVSVHDLMTFQLLTTVAKSKGAVLFSADLEEQVSSRGDAAYALKLCVVLKRKLQFYFWKKRDFVELHNDVVVSEAPKVVTWCKDTVFLGFKRDYSMTKLAVTDQHQDTLTDVFPTGKSMEPVIGTLDSDQVILMRDDMSSFLDCNGEPTYKFPFTWTDNPIALASQPPYLVAILPKYVEVRTIDPRLFIQSIEVPKPKFMTSWSDWLIIASSTHIWLLQQRMTSLQINQLVEGREFELALKLAKMSNDVDGLEKKKRIQQIHTSFAFELFCQKRFDESLENFAKLHTDPTQVIGLFPDLLPPTLQKRLTYPSPLPSLKREDLEKALLTLIDYLTQKRNDTLQVDSANVEETYSIVESNPRFQSKSRLLQIIDTTLLKCYLKTNDALVAPLLRLRDNHCHLEEAERVLKGAQKYRELIELYRKKGMHRKALNLLLQQSQTTKVKQGYQDDMIEYLQHIGADHIDLIFDFAPGLFKLNPTEAMKIFTADTAEVDSLPKQKVLDFLDSISSNLVVAYLEHLVFVCEEKNPLFHNQLAAAYRDKVLSLLKEFHDSLPEEDQLPWEEGPVDLVETRNKLINFLEISTYYDPQRILSGFPQDKLIEERALLLGRMGLYQQALALYAHTLKDSILAEKFCQKVYEQNPAKNGDVYICLLKMYLQPDSSDSSIHEEQKSINLLGALRIMYQHSTKIDAEKALSMLPTSVNIASIRVFIHDVLESQTEKRHQVQLLQSLLLSESQQVHEQRIFYENKKCVISDERVCRVCKKKIGTSAFARYPNDIVVHYFCCKDRKVQPVMANDE